MLDKRFILENPELVQENCDRRGVKVDVARFVELESQRRKLQAEVEELSRQANVGQQVDRPGQGRCRARGPQGRRPAASRGEGANQAAHRAARRPRPTRSTTRMPNLTHPEAPVGGEDASKELRRGKIDVRPFGFPVLDHVAAGRAARSHRFRRRRPRRRARVLLPQERSGAAGARAAAVRDRAAGARGLHADDHARPGPRRRAQGHRLHSARAGDADLQRREPRPESGGHGRDHARRPVRRRRSIEAEKLPIKLCGISHCFRTEAGAAGRASRGLYRVHQFTKVEMFAFTLPEQSEDMHNYFCDLECEIFDGLGIPYRVLDIATGDLGGPAYRKFDLEAWMPGRGDGGEYGEVTSASNCTDYQSRRLDIRYKVQGRKGHAPRPHAQRHGRRHQPRADRHSGKLPAGRRLDPRSRSAAPLGRQRPHRRQRAVAGGVRVRGQRSNSRDLQLAGAFPPCPACLACPLSFGLLEHPSSRGNTIFYSKTPLFWSSRRAREPGNLVPRPSRRFQNSLS